MDSQLDQLLTEAKSEQVASTSEPTSRQPITKMSYSHKALVDLMIAQPWISNNDLAKSFGYTAAWVSTIKSSDAFKAYLAQRTDEIVDPLLRLTAKEHFEGLMNRSLEILREKLSAPAVAVSDQLALRTFELTSRAAGFGARVDLTPPTPPGDLHVHLTLMAEKLPQLLRAKKVEAIEHQPSLPTEAST